jgi:predicted nucleotidyltransferase component of viral defense system
MLGKFDPKQIRKTAIQLGIPTDFVKKDYFVTSAIQAITNVENDFFALIFQGGTSLSKGYQIIRRMSEDVDFRMTQKPAALALGKSGRRKELREFRYSLIEALRKAEFQISDEGVNVFYEGRFMSIQAAFPDSQKITYLRPHVAIECFLGEMILEPQTRNITTLTKVILSGECEHDSFPVECVALDETAAEKWVALTRRVANSQIKSRQSDKHLVRHLYDLYHLNLGDLLTGDYRHIAQAIIEKDRTQFKNHNAAYAEDPLRISELALDALFTDSKWRDHWEQFLTQMVYEENKPSFDKAYGHLQQISKDIFNSFKEK